MKSDFDIDLIDVLRERLPARHSFELFQIDDLKQIECVRRILGLSAGKTAPVFKDVGMNVNGLCVHPLEKGVQTEGGKHACLIGIGCHSRDETVPVSDRSAGEAGLQTVGECEGRPGFVSVADVDLFFEGAGFGVDIQKQVLGDSHVPGAFDLKSQRFIHIPGVLATERGQAGACEACEIRMRLHIAGEIKLVSCVGKDPELVRLRSHLGSEIGKRCESGSHIIQTIDGGVDRDHLGSTISVRVDDDEEFVARELARFDFLAIPVVDNLHRLVGIVTLDDALDVLEEEATEDAQMQAAIQPLDESYMTTPFLVLAQKRGVWLVILLAAAFLTAWVMRGYEDLQRSYLWMAAFIPLVLASGGNAGSQSATLIIREMATTEMDSRDKYFIVMRELRMALTLGGGLMALSFAVAVSMVAVPEAIVVAVTVFMMVVFGTTAGVILPLVFKRLGMDPALMSNPLIAALVDVLGVVIYFSTALALLGPVAKAVE